MVTIRVCSIDRITQYASLGAKYLVSFLIEPSDADHLRPTWIAPDNHFCFYLVDTVRADDPDGPTREDIARLVELGKTLASPGSEAVILIHCAAGISRSPAAAFTFWCTHLGPGKERDAMVETVRSCENRSISPNTLMVRYADELLERQGRMIAAVEEYRRAWRASYPDS